MFCLEKVCDKQNQKNSFWNDKSFFSFSLKKNILLNTKWRLSDSQKKVKKKKREQFAVQSGNLSIITSFPTP